jgi:AAA family ATP:ADP antiporter
MIAHVGRTFGMRREEFGPASLLFFYLFLMVGGFYMGQSVGDALFLSVFPRHLPYAMIGSAVVIGGFTAVYIRFSLRARMEPLIIGTLLFFTLSFVLFWWLTRLQLRWVYMLVYIWVQNLGAMGPMMGWTLANYVLTTREARRVFGFIQAGAIIGVVFIGFITADVIRHSRIPPQTLLLVVGLIVGVCALLVKLLFRQSRQRLGALALAPAAGHGTPKNFRQSCTTIRNSRYLSLLTGLIAIGCLATSVLSYQFKLIAKASYGVDTVGLTGFFSRFYGYMGLATFVFQLALTGPLLRAFGIRATLFVLPITLVGSSASVLLAPTLFFASILRGNHYLLRYSLDKSSTELLYLPVAPEVKSQVKSFIDTFVWRSADGVAGLALLLFAGPLKFSPGRVSLVNTAFLLGWLAIAYGVRREYVNVLRQAIERRTLDPERTAAGVVDSTTTEILALALQRDEEQQLLYGLSLFEMGHETTWHPALRGLLRHPSPTVRQRALRLLSDAGDRKILPQVEKMLGDESTEVRTEALHYLVVHTGRDPVSLLPADTEFANYSITGLVASYLARPGEAANLPAARAILQTMLSQRGPDAVCARTEAARALGEIPPPSELHAELLKLLHDENLNVQEQALLSAGKILDREFLPAVIPKLEHPRLRGAARATLALYGERAVGTLQDYLNDPAVPESVRKQIPNVLARIATPASATVLANSLIQSDPGLRYDVLKALNKLRRSEPTLLPMGVDFSDLLDAELMGYCRSFQILAAFDPEASTARRAPADESLLARALRERMDHEFERLFRLLALLYPPRDIYNTYVGLTSGRPQLQANSLEMLEHLLRPDLYRRLTYVLDPEIPVKEKLRFGQRLCHTTVGSKADALRVLLHSADSWLCACALHAVGESGMTELSEDVRHVPHESNPLLDETWNWASNRLATANAA